MINNLKANKVLNHRFLTQFSVNFSYIGLFTVQNKLGNNIHYTVHFKISSWSKLGLDLRFTPVSVWEVKYVGTDVKEDAMDRGRIVEKEEEGKEEMGVTWQ